MLRHYYAYRWPLRCCHYAMLLAASVTILSPHYYCYCRYAWLIMAFAATPHWYYWYYAMLMPATYYYATYIIAALLLHTCHYAITTWCYWYMLPLHYAIISAAIATPLFDYIISATLLRLRCWRYGHAVTPLHMPLIAIIISLLCCHYAITYITPWALTPLLRHWCHILMPLRHYAMILLLIDIITTPHY